MTSEVLPGPGTAAPAAAQPGLGGPVAQTDASVPAHLVTMIAATPEEPGAPGRDEAWGLGSVGESGSTKVLVRYYLHPGLGGEEEGTWTLGPALPSGFEPLGQGPLFGEMTPRGTGVLAGERGKRPLVLLRKAGGSFEEAGPAPAEGEALAEGEEPLLKKGEVLFDSTRAPLIAPLEEEEGKAGALVVPVTLGEGAAVEAQVLHWDGHAWTREPIEVPAESAESLRVLAIGASSPTNAWLLAQLASNASFPPGTVALFRRKQEGGQWSWKPVTLSAGAGDGKAHPLTVPVQVGEPKPFTVPGTGSPPTVKGQLLTVTSEGVWIDGERADVHVNEPATATLFFKPEGAAGGSVRSSWCKLPAATPSGTPACLHQLPEALPSGYSRSIAWPRRSEAEPFGARVITGLAEGVSLRLEGEAFTPVLALGAGRESFEDPGASLGAAFSEPTEGWLGENGPPVHLTEKPAPSRLTLWPAPFRHPLLAIAPQPGAPVGSLASGALAVGSEGAVARYKPGTGWLPESLFGPSERVETPRLRAVAWPTPTRAYAVGDHGQMWLWRAETGLWERDPATPLNFRGDLLGVAFDPNNPARGYAVGTTELGSGGVLLRYGKSWTEETQLPAEVQGASFTSIAFAGSEAIVAYRRQPDPQVQSFVGGLLVNDGSGWRVDTNAVAAIGNGVPSTVAGLADGGAAFTTTGGSEGERVYERESAGAPWVGTPTPLPGNAGELALFREGGALRAIVAGGGAGNPESRPAAPPGAPPTFYEPIGDVNAGVTDPILLRQTAAGWRDESHELNPIKQPRGAYAGQDLPYRPDPILAVLVDPTGSQGWAVGGEQGGGQPRLQTGDIERYPSDGVPPTGVGEAPVPLEAADTTLAIGGHAECLATCWARAQAGVGPQVWLSSGLALARKVGARAFLYMGPSMTRGEVEGPRSLPLPFGRELERTAAILAPSPPLAPAFVAASPQDRDARPEREGTEATFQDIFAGFPQPFGGGAPAGGLAPAPEASPGNCGTEVNCHYFAIESEGTAGTGRVRVVVLDESAEVGENQRNWLAGQLAGAKVAGVPAIVIGSADLNAQVAAGQVQAARLVEVLVAGGASAYIYDSPEENVEKSLKAGGESIPAFGSGTLGYEQIARQLRGDFHGASSIMLADVEGKTRNPRTNRARVIPRVIPLIGELALEAKDGILLRRSEPALFDGLARRPRAGGHARPNGDESEEDPYIAIPTNCVGKECATALQPEYTFSSSRPDIGDFVEPNLASAGNPHAVEQGPNGATIPDAQSGLFCAFNAGTTIVTISAGGLSSSLPVTVQPGSVRQPCGTTPLLERQGAQAQGSAPAPPPAPASEPAGAAPASTPPPVPLPPPPASAPPAAHIAAAHLPPPFFVPAAITTPLLAFVPPPVPTPARPNPPTGTSAVTSPVEVAEREEEQEEAPESVSNQAASYRADEHEPSPLYLLGVVLLAAFAGAAGLRRPRRGPREVRVAPATVTATRAQRRMSRESRRPL